MSRISYMARSTRAWLLTEVKDSDGMALDDLWYKYLGDKGYQGSLTDKMYDFLGDLGYQGTLLQRWEPYFEDVLLPKDSEYDDLY